MKKNSSKIFSSGEHKLVSLAKFGAFLFTKPGLALIRKVVRKKLAREQAEEKQPLDYATWLGQNTTAPPTPLRDSWPSITILMNAHGADEQLLMRAIMSVTEQTYPHWELICAYAGSGAAISYMAGQEPRIKLAPPSAGKDAPAAHKKATGDYLLWMRADDVLATNCLAWIATHANTHPVDEVIYADEDHIASNGVLSSPFFKPGWSPDTLLSRNYIGHNIVAERSLLAGRNEYGSYYELVLDLTMRAKRIAHIPRILFHCSLPPFGDTGREAALNALETSLAQRGIAGSPATVPGADSCYKISYAVSREDKVSIIIPTKDNAELLQKTIDSILQKTEYPNYEIIVLNNNSTSSAFFTLKDVYAARHPDKLRCVEASFPFNFARLMNLGAQLSTGAYLLMCNNDIEVLHAGWMTQMVAQAQQQHTGAVGAKLLFSNDTIQHAGIALGGDEASEHVFAHRDKDDDGYFFSLKANTNYAAVTAACLMCRKTVFEQVGGMDEALAVEYNDIDLCLKFLKAGYYNVVLPSVVLYHYESATRGHPFRSKASWQQHEKELKLFRERWQAIIDTDPYYNRAQKLDLTYKPKIGL